MFENNLRSNNTNESQDSVNKSRGKKEQNSTDKGRSSISNLAAMFGGAREDSQTSNERSSRIVRKPGASLGDAFMNKMR